MVGQGNLVSISHLAAEASRACACVATALGAGATGEGVAERIVAAHPAPSDADVSATNGIVSASKFDAIPVRAVDAQLVLAHGPLRHRVFDPKIVLAALAVLIHATVAAAFGVRITLETEPTVF